MSLFSAAKFRSSLRHFLFGRAAQGAIYLIFTLLCVRALHSSDYGAYLIVIALTDLARPFSSLGVLPLAQQFLPEMALRASLDQFRAFVRWLRLIRWSMLLATAAVLVTGWQLVAEWAGLPAAARSLTYLSCFVVMALLAVEFVETLLEAMLDQRQAQLVRFVHALLRLIGLLGLMASRHANLSSILWLEGCAALICWMLAEVLLYRRMVVVAPSGGRIFKRDELVRFSVQMAGSQVLNAFATAGALRLAVARVLGVDAAGHFGFMQMLIGQANKLLPSLLLVNVIRPMLIAALIKGELKKVTDACGLMWRSNVLLLWPVVPLVFLGGEQLIAWLSGGRVQGSGLAMAGMMLALVSIAQAQVNAVILSIHKRSGDILKAGLLAPLVPLCVAVGGLHSLSGAAFGMFAAVLLRGTCTTWMIQASTARMHIDAFGLALFALSVGTSFLVAHLAQSWIPVWAAACLFVVVLLAQMPVVKPLLREDLATLQAALNRRLGWLRPFVSARGAGKAA